MNDEMPMKKYSEKKELELVLHILLDATRRGWLEDRAIFVFTRAMLIGGEIIRMKGGKKLKEATTETFKKWISACEAAEKRSINRIVLNAEQYNSIFQYINTLSRTLNHTSNSEMIKAQTSIDNSVI